MTLLVKRLGYVNVHPYYVYMHDLVKGVEDLRTTLADRRSTSRSTCAASPPASTRRRSWSTRRAAAASATRTRTSTTTATTGISVFTAPSVKPAHVPATSIRSTRSPPEAQARWADPAEQDRMVEEAARAAAGRAAHDRARLEHPAQLARRHTGRIIMRATRLAALAFAAAAAIGCGGKGDATVDGVLLAQADGLVDAPEGATLAVDEKTVASAVVPSGAKVVRLAVGRKVPWNQVQKLMRKVEATGARPVLLAGNRSHVKAINLEDEWPSEGSDRAIGVIAFIDGKACVQPPGAIEAKCVQSGTKDYIERAYVRELVREQVKMFSIEQVEVELATAACRGPTWSAPSTACAPAARARRSRCACASSRRPPTRDRRARESAALGHAEPVAGVVLQQRLDAVGPLGRRLHELDPARRQLLVGLLAVGRLEHAGAQLALLDQRRGWSCRWPRPSSATGAGP